MKNSVSVLYRAYSTQRVNDIEATLLYCTVSSQWVSARNISAVLVHLHLSSCVLTADSGYLVYVL